MAACLVLACLVLTGILKFAGVIGVKTEVTLKADKIEIQQNSQDPVNLTATATSEDEKKAAKVWLDKKKGYSVADFINELERIMRFPQMPRLIQKENTRSRLR